MVTLHDRVRMFLADHDSCGPGSIVDDSTVLEFVESEIARVTAERDAALAEVEAMREVVDAAEGVAARLRTGLPMLSAVSGLTSALDALCARKGAP